LREPHRRINNTCASDENACLNIMGTVPQSLHFDQHNPSFKMQDVNGRSKLWQHNKILFDWNSKHATSP